MRVPALIAMLAAVLATASGAAAAAPAPAKGGLCKVVCAPAPPPQARPQPKAKPAPAPVRRVVRHRARHHAARSDYARSDYYSYREAESVRDESHGAWYQAPNDAVIPGPAPYGQHGGYYTEGYAQNYQSGGTCDCGDGLQVDRSGWTGGVGYAAGGEGFMDGYGVMHFANASFQNGPTYNSYSQSFQFNPSRPGPFQPRVMGGFSSGARMGGYGRR